MKEETYKQVSDILEETAPLAAETLRTSLRSGSGQKTDKAYLSALEILDRAGFGKQTQTTVKHEGIPSLPQDLIAGALTMLAKMFNQEQSLKDVTIPHPQDEPEPAPPERLTDNQPPEQDIPFSISEELK
jgi:hypothetical protein